jgi:hypothetical protein
MASKVIVMPIEGFLKKPVGGHINESAYYLYRALSPNYSLVLTTAETDRQKTLAWLAQEGIYRYDNIVYGDFQQNASDTPAINMFRYLKLVGYRIEFWITIDPKDALDLIALGQPVLQYVDPAYALPEWLPYQEKAAETWEVLTAKIEVDRQARMLDDRMSEQVE